MMCQRIGFPPISTIGLGRPTVSSLRRDPIPPARMTAFMMSAHFRDSCRYTCCTTSIHETTRMSARLAPFGMESKGREKWTEDSGSRELCRGKSAIQSGKNYLVNGKSVTVLTEASKIPNRFAAASQSTQWLFERSLPTHGIRWTLFRYSETRCRAREHRHVPQYS